MATPVDAPKVRARASGRAGVLGESFDSVLAAARTGAPWAFEKLWQALAPSVSGYLHLQGAPDPDDLVSEVFLSVFSGLESFQGGEDRFRSWVFTIAHHRLVDDWRRRGRRPALADSGQLTSVDPPGGDVEQEALRRLSEERVRRICDLLAPDQRDVVLLRMVAGLSLEQTADALGKTTIAVKALQHRAVAALRRHLDREGVSL